MPKAMAHCVPPSWSTKADTLLTTLYKKTVTFDIDEFKRLNELTGFPVSRHAYDLVFLQSRLEELLGPCTSGTDPRGKVEPGILAPTYIDKTWLKLEVKHGRSTCVRCTHCNATQPAIYMDVKTKQLRCGHCGNMDSRHLVKGLDAVPGHAETRNLKHEETAEQPAKSRPRVECQYKKERMEQSSNGDSEEAETLPGDLDIPSKRRANDLPPNWNVFNDMILKHWYRKDPKQFDVDRFKREMHLTFHGAPNLCISPSSYDTVFLHDRLDKLIGPCICRLSKEDRANIGPDDEPSFFHREWRAFRLDHIGRRLYCDLCKVSPPVICRNERSKEEYRCGSCGNPKVGRMPCDEAYNGHLNSIIESWRYILDTRMAAGLSAFPLEVVYSDIRTRMRAFRQDRSDKLIAEHEPSQKDEQEKIGIKVESAQPKEEKSIRARMEVDYS